MSWNETTTIGTGAPMGISVQDQMNKPQAFGISQQPVSKVFEPVPEGLTLEQMKEYHQHKDAFDVYLIERNVRQLIIMTKMLCLELELKGHRMMDKDIADMQELSRKV